MDTELLKRKCLQCRSIRFETEFGIRSFDIPYKTCKVCRSRNKKRKCIHNRQKYKCKECKGSGICIHNRIRYQCKECKGGSFCIHNRQKCRCKECKGASICIHNRQRSYCKECGGSGLCHHGKRKNLCKECSGFSICIHNRQKYSCRECKGSNICQHDKHKRICKKCKGSSICQHNKVRSTCKECEGGSICKHDKQRRQCITCTSKRACQNCKHIYVAPIYRFHPYCFRCYCVLNPDADIPRKFKLKEHYLRDTLKEAFPELKIVFDKKIDGGCSRRRPDVRIECLTHSIIIECDENQHKNYICENKRMMEVFQDLGSRPLIFIRFNPDSYITKGKSIEGCFRTTKTGSLSLRKTEWSKRITKLSSIIGKHSCTIPEKEITIEKLYYD